MRFKCWPILFTVAAIFSCEAIAQQCEKVAASLESLEGLSVVKTPSDENWRAVSLGYQFCYGDTFKVEQLRATLRLENDTLVKLNQGAVIKFVPPKESFWVEIIDGVAHFISRTPKSFTVKAPYLNAGVEGTEFIVAHNQARDTVSVVEGIVVAANELGSTRLQAMQQSYATEGSAPSPALVISLPDVVDWSLYYPPAFIPPNTSSPAAQAYSKGDFATSYQLALTDGNSEIAAALSLFYGQRQAFDTAIQSSDELVTKVLLVMQKLIQGDGAGALVDSQALVAKYPTQPSALLAHSYTQQANGELTAALASAQQAAMTSDSAIIELRIAELALIIGDQTLANKSLQALNQTNFYSAYADSLRALIALQNNRNRKAFKILQGSLAKNPNIPLTQFAMGLTNIRLGKLETGRQKLELAVALDPSNSLYRSYLGKAYAEENRADKAQDQLDLAKLLDPNDPTPWFYQGLNQQANGEYASAIESYEQSIELNDTRNIYRSNSLLQSDAAIKSANIGTSYNQRGLNKKAQLLGSQITSDDPNSYAGHSLLVEAYAGNNQKESLLASERLKATLSQPLGATAMPIGLLEPGLQTTNGASPSDIGISEYTNLFIEDGLGGRATLLGGSDELGAYDVALQAKREQVAISLGQYKYKTNGYRENNDAEYQISNALLHWEPIGDLSFQIEYGQFDDEHGDLSSSLEPDDYLSNYRVEQDSKIKRVSTSYIISKGQGVAVNYSSRKRNINYEYSLFYDFGDGSGGMDYEFINHAAAKSDQFDARYYIHTLGFGDLNFGVNYFNFVSEDQEYSFGEKYSSEESTNLKSVYVDYNVDFDSVVKINFGVDYSDFEQIRDGGSNAAERDLQDRFVPYVGVSWSATEAITMRGAYSEAYAFDPQSYISLKVTNVAGFSRVLDFQNGTKVDLAGIGLDFNLAHGFDLYLEKSRYSVTNSTYNFGEEGFRYVNLPINFDESAVWLEYSGINYFAMILKFRNQEYTRKKELKAPYIAPLSLESDFVDAEIRFMPAANFEFSLQGRYLNQNIEREAYPGDESFSHEEAVVLGLSMSYFFLGRQGELKLEGNNILNESYLYAGEDIFSFIVNTNEYALRRSILGSVTYNF